MTAESDFVARRNWRDVPLLPQEVESSVGNVVTVRITGATPSAEQRDEQLRQALGRLSPGVADAASKPAGR